MLTIATDVYVFPEIQILSFIMFNFDLYCCCMFFLIKINSDVQLQNIHEENRGEKGRRTEARRVGEAERREEKGIEHREMFHRIAIYMKMLLNKLDKP